MLIQTDAKRHAFSRVERPSTAGAALELTIDEYLQHIAERELRAGVEWAGADGGSAIVMDPVYRRDPRARELADVQSRTRIATSREELRRNRAIQDLYEPGSTFKIVTASAALEEQRLTPSTIDRCQRRRHPLRLARDRRDRPQLRRAVVRAT